MGDRRVHGHAVGSVARRYRHPVHAMAGAEPQPGLVRGQIIGPREERVLLEWEGVVIVMVVAVSVFWVVLRLTTQSSTAQPLDRGERSGVDSLRTLVDVL